MSARTFDGLPLPTGVCVTRDKEWPVVFAYVGGHQRQRAKRFTPSVHGGLRAAIAKAAAWRQRESGVAA